MNGPVFVIVMFAMVIAGTVIGLAIGKILCTFAERDDL